MVKLPTLRFTRLLKDKWLGCESIESLHALLKLDKSMLQLLGKEKYHVFTTPKKNGSVRIIENPGERLKTVQRKMNDYLQAVYYFFKHPSSYGFCMMVRRDKFPCNIYTHALQHTGCSYLLNADLRDFFHAITWQRLYDALNSTPFIHDNNCIRWICDITTHQGRLPMGAPTSPVLSNIAATGMDHTMESLGKRYNCKYTRYADDLSFSSPVPFENDFKEELFETVRSHGFLPNMEKFKVYGKQDTKLVTGLQVSHTVSVGEAYWKKVEMLLTRLQSLECLLRTKPAINIFNYAEETREKINGFLAFAEMIESESHLVDNVRSRLEGLEEELEEFESITWDDIPYHF